MSNKKNFINKDRFKKLSNLSTFDENNIDTPQQSNQKSRFDIPVPLELTNLIEVSKLVSSPKDWNFYSALPEDKFYELLKSIEKNSLLHPIVVWEKDNNYMILSGHNRVEAYKKLYEISQDTKYLKIPAIIKKNQDIDENTAKEIIIDTNWIQRQLSTYEKTQSILQKYVHIKSQKVKGEKTRDIIATKLGISGRMVQNYLSLNKLDTSFFEMIDSGQISIKTAILISKLDKNTQQLLAKNKEKIHFNTNILKKIISNKDTKNIINQLSKDKEDDDFITIKIQIRKDQKEDFMKMYQKWLYKK